MTALHCIQSDTSENQTQPTSIKITGDTMQYADSARTIRASNKHAIALAVTLAISGTTTAVAAEEASITEVVVTGSRIQQTSGFETPTPVTTVTVDQLDDLDPGQLVDSLAQLPVFFNT